MKRCKDCDRDNYCHDPKKRFSDEVVAECGPNKTQYIRKWWKVWREKETENG